MHTFRTSFLRASRLPIVLLAAFLLAACNDKRGVAADVIGVGAECSTGNPCASFAIDGGAPAPLTCLTQFKGGYCGIEGCTSSMECPTGSLCVHHTDGNNYCFRACATKADCNVNRTPVNESNCSSSFTWAVPSEDTGAKACIPPSGV